MGLFDIFEDVAETLKDAAEIALMPVEIVTDTTQKVVKEIKEVAEDIKDDIKGK